MSEAPDYILEMDRRDPLAAKRQEFALPADTVYLDGNSLGPLPISVREQITEVVEQQWGSSLIRSWNEHDWINLPTRVAERIAPLLGAAPGQTVCCDSISVNLFKLLAAALQLNSSRSIVLSQVDNFPTDLYTVEGLADLLGESRCELKTVADTELLEALDDKVSVLLLTQVNFRSGLVHDIQSITQRAHEVGALVIWDLAHSAGAVPLELDEWQVDFAVGCGYKYLNGGPGAPAFIYAAARHQSKIQQPLSGWMGHRRPFDFSAGYEAADGVERFLSGTPAIISLAALHAALGVFDGVNMAQLRAKSIALSELFIQLVSENCGDHQLQLASPIESELRGSQVAYQHPQGYALTQALIEQQIIIDFRAPNLLRFGFAPLYTSFADIYRATRVLAEVLESRTYLQAKFQQRSKVT